MVSPRRFSRELEFGRGRQPRFPSGRSRTRAEFRGQFTLGDFPAQADEAAAYNLLDESFGDTPFTLPQAVELLQNVGFEGNPMVVAQRMVENGSLRKVR